ncbi:MAG: bacterial Ig-like domain-containing protein [Treponema sp.]|jgi:hypothetical protein|nr:bacterial Ig-like domain-containing protein [Treponema sp.]
MNTKKFLYVLGMALVSLIVLGISGCDVFLGPDEPVGTGNLVIGFGEGRAALNEDTLASLRYELALTGPGGEKINVSFSAGESYSQQVTIGEWRIEAEAFTPDNKRFGEGTATVRVRAGNNLVRVPMKVIDDSPAALVSIAVTAPPTKTIYNQYESLDLTGLVVTGTYSDGGTAPLAVTMANISGFDSAAAGIKTVTVTVDGKTASFSVTVNSATLVSIAVTAPPTKTTYNQGESLDLTGLVVTGTYSDGSTAPLAVTMANISGFDSAAAGIKTVMVTVEEKTASFSVTVNPAPVYTVTVNSLTNGAVSASPTSATAGTVITLTVTPDPGWVLQAGSLKVNNGAVSVDGSGSTYTFTMPAAGVTVDAVFINASPRYVTVSGAGTKDGFSWANASDDLQKMMDELAAIPSTYTGSRIVHVAAGTYTPQYAPAPDGSRTTDFVTYSDLTDEDKTFMLRQGVEIRGGYAAGEEISEADRQARFNADGTIKPAYSTYETILSGDPGTPGDNTDNAYHVVLGVDITATTVLDGLTIIGGSAGAGGSIMVGGKAVYRYTGGGMYNVSSSPVLTNVTISGNSVSVGAGGSGGGGMYNTSSSPVLTNVTISENSAESGGGMYNNNNSSPVLTNVTISGNSASGSSGGGMYNNEYSSPVLTNVTISGNSAGGHGGGMHNYSSSPVLTNVTISGNSASGNGGGMNNVSSSPVLTNVTISGNSASGGGGMYNNTSLPVLTNVTISGNSVSGGGGGMNNQNSSSPQIRNSLIWGNTAAGIYNGGNSTPAISYSIVQGSGGSGGTWADATGTDGENNLDTDPLFADWIDPSTGGWTATDGGDYHLTTGSPAIDAGSDSLYPANADDLVFAASSLSAEAKAAINAALAKDCGGDTRIQGTAIDIGAYEKE